MRPPCLGDGFVKPVSTVDAPLSHPYLLVGNSHSVRNIEQYSRFLGHPTPARPHPCQRRGAHGTAAFQTLSPPVRVAHRGRTRSLFRGERRPSGRRHCSDAFHLVGAALRAEGRGARPGPVRRQTPVDARPRPWLRRRPAVAGLPRQRGPLHQGRGRPRRLGGSRRRGQRQPPRPLHRALPDDARPGLREHQGHGVLRQDPLHGRRPDRGARGAAHRPAHARRHREVRWRATRTSGAPTSTSTCRTACSAGRRRSPCRPG